MKASETSAAQAILAHANTPIWLVTARHSDRAGGLVATFVNPASIVPELPRVVLGLARRNHTHGLVEASQAFALHLIGEAQLDWVWRFGLASARERDKLAGLATEPGASGSPILSDARAWLDCRVEASLDIGDRTLFVAAVVAARSRGVAPALTRDRMLALAPAEKRARLQELLEADAREDAAAIREWREARSGNLR